MEEISKYVHYEVDITGDSSYDNDWRVFYEEKDTTYLIAADYMLSSKVPSVTGIETSNPYNVWWDSFKSSEASDISKNVVNKYKLSWWNDNSESTNKNAKATADLLNPSLWSDFAIYEGIEAVGAPTLEMFIESWNAKGYETLYWDYIDYGYTIGLEPSPTVRSVNVIENETEGSKDTLYLPHTIIETGENLYEGCNGYLIASPNMAGKNTIFKMFVNGGIGSGSIVQAGYSGLRPIIAVPSNLIGENSSFGKQIYFVSE